MKIIITILLSLSTATLQLNAQTQQGYVKTKGRLASNGTVIAGTRIAGATVQVKGRTAVLSQSNGAFSFPIPSQTYYLQNVQKQGFVLTDLDVLSKQYAYSRNPLVIVLETPSQQADDKLAAEKKIRRTLQRQLMEKEDKIESLKEQQKLSEEDYRKKLQEMYAQQESNEKLIGEMADRYSRMDFDEVDEFNRRISQLILDGKLTEADSLINTKGDINTRATVLRQHQEANAQAEQEIKKKQKKLEKSKELTRKELEDLAQDCYSKFEIYKMKHQNDSAGYYIVLRSDLDTTNIEWAKDAGKYCLKYLTQINKADSLFHTALNNAILSKGAISIEVSDCYDQLASVCYERSENEKGLEYYQKAWEICKTLCKANDQPSLTCLINIANAYRRIGKFDVAMDFAKQVIELMNNNKEISDFYKAKIYGTVGNIYHSMNHYDDALEYYLKAWAFFDLNRNDYPLEAITSLINIGNTCFELGQYDNALEYDNKGVELIKSVLDEKHPQMANVLNNIAAIYVNQKKVSLALGNIQKALEIEKTIYGQNNPNLMITYNNIGMVNYSLGNYQEALKFYSIAFDMCNRYFSENDPYYSTYYNNAGSVFIKTKEYNKALEYLNKALEIRIKKYGEEDSDVALVYYNIGKAYQALEDNAESLINFLKAKNIFAKTLGNNHPNTLAAQKALESVSVTK